MYIGQYLFLTPELQDSENEDLILAFNGSSEFEMTIKEEPLEEDDSENIVAGPSHGMQKEHSENMTKLLIKDY